MECSSNRIRHLEKEVTSKSKQLDKLRFCEEERNQFEKLLFDQQKIMRVALQRIIPRQTKSRAEFCRVSEKHLYMNISFISNSFLGSSNDSEKLSSKILLTFILNHNKQTLFKPS